MKLDIGHDGTEALILKAAQLPDWCSALGDVSRRFVEAGFPALMLTAVTLSDPADPKNNITCLCIDNRTGLSLAQQQSLLWHAAARVVAAASDKPSRPLWVEPVGGDYELNGRTAD